MIVSDGLSSWARRTPDQVALISRGRRWTYYELQSGVESLGAKLLGLGLGPQDRVAICLPNSAEYLIAFFAVARYGFVAMTVPETASEAELRSLFTTAGPASVVATPKWSEARRELLASYIPLERVVTPSACDGLVERPTLVQPNAPFYIGYTSGSTGSPKGVVRHHAAWVKTFDAATDAFDLGSVIRFLVPGPLHFSASLFAAVHVLEIGGTLWLEHRFSPRHLIDLIATEGITSAFMVPTFYQALVEDGGPPIGGLRSLISCGEKLRPSLRQALNGRFPAAKIYEYYGSSEVGFMTLLPPERADRSESVGLAFPQVELEARRADGTPAAPGEIGVLYARSGMMAAGYDLGAGAIESFTVADGWARTGDVGRIEEDGLVYLAGRADDAINSGGATVFPAEVEAALTAHPGVAEAAVFGRPHPRRGEEIVAVVCLRPGATVTVGELRAFCAARLASYKRPRTLAIVPELPRTESGKVLKRALLS